MTMLGKRAIAMPGTVRAVADNLRPDIQAVPQWRGATPHQASPSNRSAQTYRNPRGHADERAHQWEHLPVTDDSTLPETLTLDEAYRAAFFLTDLHVGIESNPDEGLALFHSVPAVG